MSYDYNLAGQLKSLADHTSQKVNYGYDNAGRLNSLIGANYSANQFINSHSYRAWNAPKQVAYGNGRTATINYNSRLRPTHFEIPASAPFNTAMSFDYQYYDDGRLKFSKNVLDNRFDRSYEYDHAVRLRKALSGAEARGEPATTNRPYKETATYDEFGHLKTRSSLHWSRTLGFGSSDTYSNNRRVGWSYDADGNWISGAGRQHTYDAAGRNSATSWSSGGSFSQLYDGDAQRVKATEFGGGTYYLRSTILDGQVIEELDSSGAKQVGFVYAGGKLIGHQTGTGNVSLIHEEPSGVSLRASSASSSFVTNWAELDPWGAEVYSSDPYLADPTFSGGRGEGGPVFPGFGDISMPSTGCTRLLDGVLTLCDFVHRNLNGGGIQVERRTNGTTERLSIEVILGVARIWHPPRSGNSPLTIDYSGSTPVARTNNSEPGYWEFLDMGSQVSSCEEYLATLFGDAGSYFADVDDGDAVDLTQIGGVAKGSRPPMGHERHVHLYGSASDPKTSTNVYVPANAKIVSLPKAVRDQATNPYVGRTSNGDATYSLFYFKKLGSLKDVTLFIVHIADFSQTRQKDGRIRVGTLGGYDEGGSWTFNINGTEMPSKHVHLDLWYGKWQGPAPPSKRPAIRAKFSNICPPHLR